MHAQRRLAERLAHDAVRDVPPRLPRVVAVREREPERGEEVAVRVRADDALRGRGVRFVVVAVALAGERAARGRRRGASRGLVEHPLEPLHLAERTRGRTDARTTTTNRAGAK